MLSIKRLSCQDLKVCCGVQKSCGVQRVTFWYRKSQIRVVESWYCKEDLISYGELWFAEIGMVFPQHTNQIFQSAKTAANQPILRLLANGVAAH